MKIADTKAEAPKPSTSPTIVAALGMRVETMLDGWGPQYATILHIEPDACIIRLDKPRNTSDGDAANVAAVPWEEVLLCDIRPAPPAPTSAPSDAPVRCIVKPGMRAQVSVNDGNDEMDGTVIWVHPECVVVELDERTKNDGGKFAACEWDRVTMLNMGPDEVVEGGSKAANHAA